jgi:peptidoglycan-N-acetylglucosamine deacetylase
MTFVGGLRRVAFAALAVSFALCGTGCSRNAGAPALAASSSRPVSSIASAEGGGAVDGGPQASLRPSSSAATPVATALVFHGDPKVHSVALTFDLCQTPDNPSGFDSKLVGELMAAKVPATFMMGGDWARTHPARAKLLGGVSYFEIGNHSYAHKHPTKITAAEFRQEIELAQQAIERYAGRTPTVFRFPYGEYDAATLREVTAEGLVPAQWSVVSGDPDPKVTAADIVREVERSAGDGSIVIMHANNRGVHTAEALPEVVRRLRAKGYKLVTVSELLGR